MVLTFLAKLVLVAKALHTYNKLQDHFLKSGFGKDALPEHSSRTDATFTDDALKASLRI